jgi:uncharacterized protein YjiS (DUF1127 family)
MAAEYFDTSARAHSETGFFQKLARAFDSIDRARAARRTCNRLNNMSDAELASRGIRREDIPKIVIQQLQGCTPTQSDY